MSEEPNTCRNCKHWGANREGIANANANFPCHLTQSFGNRREQLMSQAYAYAVGSDEYVESRLYTSPGFGCNQFEPLSSASIEAQRIASRKSFLRFWIQQIDGYRERMERGEADFDGHYPKRSIGLRMVVNAAKSDLAILEGEPK